MLKPYAHATFDAAHTTYASAAAYTTYASAAAAYTTYTSDAAHTTTPCREKLSGRVKLQANTGQQHQEFDNAAPRPKFTPSTYASSSSFTPPRSSSYLHPLQLQDPPQNQDRSSSISPRPKFTPSTYSSSSFTPPRSSSFTHPLQLQDPLQNQDPSSSISHPLPLPYCNDLLLSHT
ncbi:hypothetical protein CsSME_00007323 [Camellia sinensis var. sinensis]